MDIEDAIGYMKYLADEDVNEKIFIRWVLSGQDREMSFSDFKSALTPAPQKSDETVLKEALDIISKMKGRGDGNI